MLFMNYIPHIHIASYRDCLNSCILTMCKAIASIALTTPFDCYLFLSIQYTRYLERKELDWMLKPPSR